MHGYTALLALEHVTPRLVIRHTPASGEDESLETIAVERTLGARTFAERRVLDGVEVARVGALSGRPLRVRARRAPPAALACAWLRAEDAWLPESFVDGELVHTSSRCEPAGVVEDEDSEAEEDEREGDKGERGEGGRGEDRRGEDGCGEGGCGAAWRIEQVRRGRRMGLTLYCAGGVSDRVRFADLGIRRDRGRETLR